MITVPLSKLIVSPLNCRDNKQDDPTSGEMLRSLSAHGLLEPLVVHELTKPKNKMGVLCGSRRLGGLQQLRQFNKDDPEGFPIDKIDFDAIPVVVRTGTDEELREISAAENMVRLNLSPAEEAAAFAGFAGTPEEIARHFGKTVRHVKQRLRLGTLAPPIFKALADGRLSLEAAYAYAGTDNREVQERVFKALGINAQDWQIRREIRGASDTHDVQSKLKFVGREAYEAAGGRFVIDLFVAEEQELVVQDVDILNTVFQADYDLRLRKMTEQLAAKYGVPFVAVHNWNEVGPHLQYETGDLPADKQTEYDGLNERRAEIEDKLETLQLDETIEDDDFAHQLGALESELEEVRQKMSDLDAARPVIFPEGTTEIRFIPHVSDGQVHASQFFFAPQPIPSASNAMPVPGVPSPPPPPPEPEGPKLTAKADQALAEERRLIFVKLLDDADPFLHGFGTDFLVFSLARGRFKHETPTHMGHMGPGNGPPPWFVNAPWFTAEDEAEGFALYQAQDEEEKEHAAQSLVGRMIVPHRATLPGVLADVGQNHLEDPVIRSRGYWTPTIDFFNLFTKTLVCDMVAEIDKEQAATMAKMKGGEAKDRAVAFFLGNVPGTNAEAARAWVPTFLRFSNPPEDGEPGAEEESPKPEDGAGGEDARVPANDTEDIHAAAE